MIVLSTRDIKLSYGIDVILKSVSFSIQEGDKVALIGANGAGKSSLFKILTKEITEYEGEVFLDRQKSLGYLSQNINLDTEKTIHEEALSVFQHLMDMEDRMLYLEEEMKKPYEEAQHEAHEAAITDYVHLQEKYDMMGGRTYKGEVHKVLRGLGFEEEEFTKRVSILSGGQKTRVALAKLLLSNPDIILLDEPTNHLDLQAIEWLEEYLKSYKGTLLIISHDRFFLDSITSHTFEMIRGEIYTYNAPYTKYLELKEKDYEIKMKAYRHQQEEIARQEKIIERYKSFNREKSIKAAESRQKMLDKIERIEAPPKARSPYKISFDNEIESGTDVLIVENLSKAFEDTRLFENLSFHIRKAERIALIGENGRGKTTLFKMLLDRVTPDQGDIILGKNVTLGYYDQEQSDLHPEKTVMSELHDEFPHLTEREVRTYLGSFLFRGDEVFKEVKNLSGGEKCRVNLLKLMLKKSNFLILDEPTNHLDIPSREALEDALLDYDGTLFVISHDRYFLNKVVHKIFELKEDGIVEYLGNYSYYMDKKLNPNRFQGIEEKETRNKTQYQDEKKKKKGREKEEREKKKRLKTLEETIEKMEAEKEALTLSLTTEEVYKDIKKSMEISDKIKEVDDKIKDHYEEWELLLMEEEEA
ncbi:ABC-F family ATP-binding cassette domain-containing protein [Proteiniclasticum ruminis]|uniref:ATP-binding cassette, subfamily F, member 3 n=2 Tax=Proteiniclasticum ruminis TaxID=398199 RepID=A0A1G8PRF8_9CLOT|nr:ABC-F family ATP-binding cassette domain-containing protein [Proteiniclasticum ruminis]SDI95012.1 ATP-binding cassette, subfamily F, member 3 [Proteiniclasticum ruminis]